MATYQGADQLSAGKRFDFGLIASAAILPVAFAKSGQGRTTSGTWMKSSSPSVERNSGSGEQSIRPATFSTYWFKRAVIQQPTNASSQGSSGNPASPAAP